MDASVQIATILGTRQILAKTLAGSTKAEVMRGLIASPGIRELIGFSSLEQLLTTGEADGFARKDREIPEKCLTYDTRIIHLSTHYKELLKRLDWNEENPYRKRLRHDETILLSRRGELVLWDGYCDVVGNPSKAIYKQLNLSIVDDLTLAVLLNDPRKARWFEELIDALRALQYESILRRERQLDSLRNDYLMTAATQRRLGFYSRIRRY